MNLEFVFNNVFYNCIIISFILQKRNEYNYFSYNEINIFMNYLFINIFYKVF